MIEPSRNVSRSDVLVLSLAKVLVLSQAEASKPAFKS
jgi:hypothetical protein